MSEMASRYDVQGSVLNFLSSSVAMHLVLEDD